MSLSGSAFYLEKNPAHIRGAARQVRRKNLRPASATELTVMVDTMPERLRLLLLLATWCALRSGELRELRRTDVVITHDETGAETAWVEVSHGVVRVRKTAVGPDVSTRSTESLVGASETEAGFRSVSIPDFLIPAVRDHLARYAAPGPVADLRVDGHPAPSARQGRAELSRRHERTAPPMLKTVVTVLGWRRAMRLDRTREPYPDCDKTAF